MWEQVLHNVSDGDSNAQACRRAGVTASALYDKLNREPEFKKRFFDARSSGEGAWDTEYTRIVKDASTPPRDRLHGIEYLKSIIYGQTPQRNVNINGSLDLTTVAVVAGIQLTEAEKTKFDKLMGLVVAVLSEHLTGDEAEAVANDLERVFNTPEDPA